MFMNKAVWTIFILVSFLQPAIAFHTSDCSNYTKRLSFEIIQKALNKSFVKKSTLELIGPQKEKITDLQIVLSTYSIHNFYGGNEGEIFTECRGTVKLGGKDHNFKLAGVLDLYKSKFSPLFVTEASDGITINFGKQYKNGYDFIFVNNFCKEEYECGHEKQMLIYGYNDHIKKITHVMSPLVKNYEHIGGDGPEGSSDYTERSEAVWGEWDEKGYRPLLILTNIEYGPGHTHEFVPKTRREVFEWNQEVQRLVLAERFEDDKPKLNREECLRLFMLRKIANESLEKSGIKLVDFLCDPKDEINLEARTYMHRKIYERSEPPPRAVIDVMVNKVSKGSSTERHQVTGFLYSIADRNKNALSTDNKEALLEVYNRDKNDDYILYILALSGEFSLQPTFIEMIRAGIQEGNGCKASTGVSGLYKLVGRQAVLTDDQIEVLRSASNSQVSCDDSGDVAYNARQLLSMLGK